MNSDPPPEPVTQELDPAFVYRDVNHILMGGQSLSAGVEGTPVLTTTQPYDNKMFSTGLLSGSAEGLTEFAPLVEATRETGGAALTSLATKIAREEMLTEEPQGEQSHDFLLTNHGTGGAAYTAIKKGTATWDLMLAQVSAAIAECTALDLSYVVRGIIKVHGETDCANGSLVYAANLAEWQTDYETDIQALTGQTDPVPMFHTQISSWQQLISVTSTLPIQQLQASIDSGGAIVMVGPKYMLAYAADGLHLTNEGYRHMGEYYAKAYRRVVLEGLSWEPVRPTSVLRSGAVITVEFAVPRPPLVLDLTRVVNPGNYGFEYTDASSPPNIADVSIVGSTTVQITLAATPTGANKRLRYAYTASGPSVGSGPTTGPRGNLRDSDPTESRHGYDLFNWCVTFDEAVP